MRRQPEHDGHHILHHRQEWTLRPEAAALRESPPLIVEIPRSLHNEIHKNVPPVPLLGHYALFRTLRAYNPVQGDSLASIDNLLLAIEEAARSPKSHAIEKTLAELAVEAIDLQRPYIKQGII